MLCCCCSTPPQGVNWKFFAKQFSAWVATLFLVGGTTALIFAQGVYSPCKPQASQVMFYEDRAANLSMSMFKSFNSSLATYKAPAMAGNLTQLSADQFKNLSAAVNYYYVDNKLAVTPSVSSSGRPPSTKTPATVAAVNTDCTITRRRRAASTCSRSPISTGSDPKASTATKSGMKASRNACMMGANWAAGLSDG